MPDISTNTIGFISVMIANVAVLTLIIVSYVNSKQTKAKAERAEDAKLRQESEDHMADIALNGPAEYQPPKEIGPLQGLQPGQWIYARLKNGNAIETQIVDVCDNHFTHKSVREKVEAVEAEDVLYVLPSPSPITHVSSIITKRCQHEKAPTMKTNELSIQHIGQTIRIERANIVGTHNYIEGALTYFDFDTEEASGYGYEQPVAISATNIDATVAGYKIRLTGNETLTINPQDNK